MRLSKIALGLGFALATVTAAQAATFTIDYRHDYRTDYGQNFDRIALIGALENGIGFYVDSSFKSQASDAPTVNGQDNPHYQKGKWGDWGSNAIEMSLWYDYKIQGTGFTITPGLVTETVSNSTAYKPYVRVRYATDFGLWFALRPRFDYARNDGSGFDNKTGRIDAWIGYGQGSFGINYNFSYMKDLNSGDHSRHLYKDNDYNTEHNIAVNYRMGKWNPYFEVGDIADVAGTGRQARIRVGVGYTF